MRKGVRANMAVDASIQKTEWNVDAGKDTEATCARVFL